MTIFMGVHLTVADMKAALDFYRRIGLAVLDGADGQVHAQIDVGDGQALEFSTVALTRAYDPGWRDPSLPPASALQFRLTSREAVDELYADLTAAGYHGHLAPFDAFWGARYAEVDDPDGNIVGFHSPRDPTKHSTPPM
jgi:uncharacterized glyoxalase superfamily protein PhnB